MGNNMSVSIFQQIKDRLNTLIPTNNQPHGSNDRKRRATNTENGDLYVLPTKSRKVDHILKGYCDYSDHEMDEKELERRKKELRRGKFSNPGTSFLNGFGNSARRTQATPSLFLCNKPISMGTPLYLVDTSFQPLANSSTRNDVPGLLPIGGRKKPPVPDALPISNGYFKDPFSTMSRGKRLTALAQQPQGSIMQKTFKEDSKIAYLALLRKIVPSIYKSPPVSATTVETQTEIDLTSSTPSTPTEVVDLTASKESQNDEKLNALMEKLQCKSAYLTKGDTLRDRFKEERRLREERIREAEIVLEEHRRDTEECHRKFRKRILDHPISFEQIIIGLDGESEEEEEKPSYPEITKSHAERIKKAISGGPGNEIIISKFNLNITRADLNTLVGMTWLNDEVINFYMNLLIERSEANPDLPKSYCFNTFFIPTLLSRGHAGVKRWTRKIDIFSYDLLPVPVHVGRIHWCMAVIRVKEKVIRYYDSMGNPNQPVLDALEQYLIDEAMDKKRQTLDTSDWVKQNVTDCPHQTNGSDCGVFSCMFAEHLTRGAAFTFGQSEMQYFRSKMIYEIATGELLT